MPTPRSVKCNAPKAQKAPVVATATEPLQTPGPMKASSRKTSPKTLPKMPVTVDITTALTRQSQVIYSSDLRAEDSLASWHTRNSLRELRKMLRASEPDEPLQLCLPPLEAPILKTTNITLPLVNKSSTERYILEHLLISIESFLASLSLLEALWNFTEICPSIPALYCDALLQRDPYRGKLEHEVARIIMEHIDTHHARLSHEVNIVLGSSYIFELLPEASDNGCRCPLQRLDMFNIPRSHPYTLVGQAYTRLTEVEGFTASHGFIDLLTAVKYFHSFEYRIAQIVRYSNRFEIDEIIVQHDQHQFILLRTSSVRPFQIKNDWSRL